MNNGIEFDPISMHFYGFKQALAGKGVAGFVEWQRRYFGL
jgi:hypothetical protein